MPPDIDLLSLTGAELLSLARDRLPAGHGLAGRFYRQACQQGRFAPEDSTLAPASAAAWRAAVVLRLPEPVRLLEEPSGTAKAVLRLVDGSEIECVRIPMGARGHTLCLSTQVGCRMGCAFCQTARLGLRRQLAPGEIVGQVVAARTLLGWMPRNLVFMGMGEPLDNAANLVQAIRVLTDQRGLHYSFERLTVCTAGHSEGLALLAAQGWKRLNLSLSLNAASDGLRDQLMPVNRRTPLAQLQRLLAAYPRRRNFTLGVNWCLIPGINDTRQDAARIADFCRPLGRVLVNLIPYNPGSPPLARAPEEAEVAAFIGWLREEGLPVRMRQTKGRSIMAGCGQLGRRP